MTDENEVFAAYVAAEGAKKLEVREHLVKLLFAHALAVCWQQLHEHCPDVANWCVYKALQKADKFRGDAKFSTWFHKIVLNACHSKLRDKLRRNEQSIDEIVNHETAGTCVHQSADARIAIDEIAARLSEDDRAFLRMKLQQLDDEAIAAMTGLTREGVRSKWSRIRKRILKGQRS